MLWIAVTLPLLSLEAVKPPLSERESTSQSNQRDGIGETASGASDIRCYALADHAHILMPDVTAYQLGVQAGQTRSYALVLAPGLQMLTPDVEHETQAFEAMALALLAYTPKVSQAHAHTLLLEVGSGLRLFGGLRALLAKVASTVRDFGYTARMACAPTAWGAWLLAHARARREGHRWHVVKEASLPRALDALPVSLLPAVATYGDVFEQIGCATLADLRRLPRAGVVRRFGSDVLDLLAQAYGEKPDPRESFRAPASFRAQLELQARVDSAEALLFAARRLVMQLAGWLSAHHAAVSRYTLLLEHELAARHAPRTSSLTVSWAVPSRDPDHLIWLLREKLNQTELIAPAIELKIVADQIDEHAAQSDTLFPMPDADRDSVARLFERLSARLGSENVMRISMLDDHRPERAMNVEAYQTGQPERTSRQAKSKRPSRHSGAKSAAKEMPTSASDLAAGGAIEPSHPDSAAQTVLPDNALPLREPPQALVLSDEVPQPPRPVWLLDKPLKLVMREQRPVYRRPLKMLTRTERIEAGWWDGQGVERDYYIAADDDGRMFWVFRERLSGYWFLQGLFG
ncbi:DNA polymerase Y family protein [Trinickia violacea]|uniref:DNA polymerase Y family protein n=1 Tax=Trinickia violacea TaxID=2571746 RepID=A0A4P8IMQ6_9BURK|nr:DNA polymerase Y family protein [Trinickia violacea]QCP48815.1 DNA polymerase Y family protein [Trinickia violacea]